jgi:hypothetical protein
VEVTRGRKFGLAINFLIGIFLTVAGIGLLIEAAVMYPTIFFQFQSCFGPGCVPNSTINYSGLSSFLILFGLGIALILYSLKFSGNAVWAIWKPTKLDPLPLPQTQTAPQPPPQPAPVPEPPPVLRCESCGNVLETDATYCPKCFQKVRIAVH